MVEVLDVLGDGVCVEKVCIYPLSSFHIVLLTHIQTMNIFSNLPTLAPPKPADIGSELEGYLATKIEHIVDPVQLWHKKQVVYPWLAHMAMDYLTTPGIYVIT